jgi:diaminopimelate epimerase
VTVLFTKMQACGNDFVVIDDRAGVWAGRESALALRVCQRRLALGADGMLLLREGRQPGHFGMVFVNADGSIGEMCGNGARCLAAFIRRAGLAQQALVLDTDAGDVKVRFLDEQQIELTLPPAGPLRADLRVTWGGRDWLFDALDVGPPHVVCLLPDVAALAALDVTGFGQMVRHHALFAPRGCNVNFVAVDAGLLHLRTYERGVEDETLGCGTGATAGVLVARRQLGLTAPRSVLTSSGETLTIDIDQGDGHLRLTGGAHFVASGELAPELLSSWVPDRP